MASIKDWIDNIVCPYCGNEDADWVKSDDACFECEECGEVDCI